MIHLKSSLWSPSRSITMVGLPTPKQSNVFASALMFTLVHLLSFKKKKRRKEKNHPPIAHHQKCVSSGESALEISEIILQNVTAFFQPRNPVATGFYWASTECIIIEIGEQEHNFNWSDSGISLLFSINFNLLLNQQSTCLTGEGVARHTVYPVLFF